MNWDAIAGGVIALSAASMGLAAQPFVDWRRYRRERSDEIADRRFEFERDALIQLEGAIAERGVFATDHLKHLQFDRPNDEIPHGAVFASTASIITSMHRINNQELRKAVDDYLEASGKMLGAHQFADALDAIPLISTTLSRLQRLLGEELRNLYDDLKEP